MRREEGREEAIMFLVHIHSRFEPEAGGQAHSASYRFTAFSREITDEEESMRYGGHAIYCPG